MVGQHQSIEALKIRVYRWRGEVMHERYSQSGVFLYRVIHDTLRIQKSKSSDENLKLEIESDDLPFNPQFFKLPCPDDGCENWFDKLFNVFKETKGELFFPDSEEFLVSTICAYLQSSFKVSPETFHGQRGFKIVIAVDVKMKTIVDEVDVRRTYSCRRSMLYDKIVPSGSDGGGGSGVVSSGTSTRFAANNCPLKYKDRVIQGFIRGGGGLKNLSSYGEEVIFRSIVEFLKRNPEEYLCSSGPAEAYEFEEIEPPVEIKKFSDGRSSSSSSADTCAICLETFGEDDRVAVTPCSHVFHSGALLHWLQNKTSCPMCRSDCSVFI